MENEIWKDIKDYEGIYQVSNYGRVKSVGKIVNGSNQYGINFRYFRKDKILRPIRDNWGYLRVSLYKNNIKVAKRIHRLVAETFIPNNHNQTIINHKNGNKEDNYVDNLEWCSQSHNVLESYRLGLQKPQTKKVLQYDLQNNFIREWDSISEPRKLYHNSHIASCCSGKRKTAGGYIWKYKS